MKLINEYIVEEALKWIGVKEIIPNKEFTNPDFDDYLAASGWKEGEAYCMYFAKQVWRNAYVNSGNSHITQQLEGILSPSAVKSYNNAKGKDMVSGIPEIGSIAIWQHYKNGNAGWQGHAGIVRDINFANNTFSTIEANTNKRGSREGEGVYVKTRDLSFKVKDNGLVLLGFIIPIKIETV